MKFVPLWGIVLVKDIKRNKWIHLSFSRVYHVGNIGIFNRWRINFENFNIEFTKVSTPEEFLTFKDLFIQHMIGKEKGRLRKSDTKSEHEFYEKSDI